MSSTLSQWINEYGSRMDQALIAHLKSRSDFLYFLPQFLRKPVERIVYKRVQIPVLVQWEAKTVQQFTHVCNPLYELGLPVSSYFRGIHTFSLALTIKNIPKILEIPEVKKIYLDRKIHAFLDTATPTIQAPQVWSSSNNRGEDATIAILDTGIAPHPDLKSRIIGFHDIVSGITQPYDDNGHGTHCAGCAAGDGYSSKGLYQGSAPRAPLVGIKVLDKYGEGMMSNLIAGIQWCLKHKDEYNIRVLSLSLGSNSDIPYQDDPVCQMVELAWKEGIVVVAAAGNTGPKSQTITSPGNHPLIITVGASDDKGSIDRADDQVAEFSSRGPTLDGFSKPDIVAPGINIVSLRSRNSFLDRTLSKNRMGKYYFYLSGTSMSTPIVAGVVALILSAHPKLTPDQVKKRIVKTAYSLNQSGNVQGSGQVDAEKAINND